MGEEISRLEQRQERSRPLRVFRQRCESPLALRRGRFSDATRFARRAVETRSGTRSAETRAAIELARRGKEEKKIMIGIGIIGSGQVALQNHLPGVALRADARVIALCDANPQTVQKASQTSGIKPIYTDHRELLKRDDVNAVIIATPNFTHEPIVRDAATAGKHVLCEKPLSLDLAGAKRMLEAVEKAGVKHMTAF